MEKGAPGGGGDPARAAVGVCEKLLTFFSKNLSMTRQKAITEGPRVGAGSDNRKARAKEEEEEEEDEFMVRIERAEFEFGEEEEEEEHHKSSTTATILGGRTARASDDHQPKEAPVPLKAVQEVAPAAEAVAAAAAQGEKKVKKTVTIKEEASEKVKKAASVVKKRERQASSSGTGEQQQGEEAKAAPAQRWGLRPRMPSGMGLRVPSNINQKSTDFIEQRRRGFGAGAGKSSRRNDD